MPPSPRRHPGQRLRKVKVTGRGADVKGMDGPTGRRGSAPASRDVWFYPRRIAHPAPPAELTPSQAVDLAARPPAGAAPAERPLRLWRPQPVPPPPTPTAEVPDAPVAMPPPATPRAAPRGRWRRLLGRLRPARRGL